MKLTAYPKAIATQQRKIQKHQIEILRPLVQAQDRLELAADRLVATNPDLKNELQRKLYRLEVLETPEYKDLCDQIQAAHDALQGMQIERDRLINEFSAEKLVQRNRIATAMQELEVMGNW